MRKHRIAVSVLFFINGFIHANWASRLPELESFLGMTHSELGGLLFVMACGAITAMPFTGYLSFRFGSHNVCRATAILLGFTAAMIAIQSNLYIEGIILFLYGLSNGAMDVAMNEQAVLVEREYKKPIMSSFHAFWSVGMASGAGSGALFSEFGIPLSTHVMIIAVLGLGIMLWSTGRMIVTEQIETTKKTASFMLPTRAILPLGLIAFCGMLSEGSMIDWSAIYVNEVVGGSEAFSAFAFGVFGAAMTIGRVFGDYFTQRLGKKRLLVIDAVMAISGLSLLLLVPAQWPSILGLFLVGVGLSTVVPIVYTTAGNTPGISPSVGIAMATTIGYSGFFVGPPTIGFLGDVYGLVVGLTFTLMLLVLMMLLILRQRFQDISEEVETPAERVIAD